MAGGNGIEKMLRCRMRTCWHDWGRGLVLQGLKILGWGAGGGVRGDWLLTWLGKKEIIRTCE